ncbi:hypothetical protein DOMOVOI_00760 [Brevundimonas phage vB_BpoS-Domovoi]|uniref:Uncharacterized protein n=1 Tax=Brevundimonas phage vB_BpoS-Domovoi TaxID=2948598 RepID=A0A9E7MPL5_9CAUD|nr:hypothetical protein DOMOVOI_00760 [Brevundimonas phage vB_BpoS-Domovoi]
MTERLQGILHRAGPNAFLTTQVSGYEDWLPIEGGVDDKVFAPGDIVTYRLATVCEGGDRAADVKQVYP